MILILEIFDIFIGGFRTIIAEIRVGEGVNHFVSLFQCFKV